MINEIKAQKNTAESYVKNVSSSKAQDLKQSGLPVIQRSITPPSGLGLPADKLSSSVISFARFFSLPLKPQLLAEIRRSAFLPANINAANSPAAAVPQGDSASAVKFREALSLAAAAAESKGAELQPKGLESYAQAADPERRYDEQKRRRSKDQKRRDDESPLKIKSADSSRSDLIAAEGLRKLFYENTRNDPLLEILNKLPGKNGRRWIVLPFDCPDYNISIRILTDCNQVSANACCMALDIKIRESENRLIFALEAANNIPVRMTVFFKKELSQKEQAKIKKELSQIMEIPVDRVSVKISEESFPYEAGFAQPPVNEEA